MLPQSENYREIYKQMFVPPLFGLGNFEVKERECKYLGKSDIFPIAERFALDKIDCRRKRPLNTYSKSSVFDNLEKF